MCFPESVRSSVVRTARMQKGLGLMGAGGGGQMCRTKYLGEYSNLSASGRCSPTEVPGPPVAIVAAWYSPWM